jgi:transcriptional regulator with XRE-family HTH domain
MIETPALCLAKNLEKYMQTNNLSLNEFAQELDEATSTVHGWLNGIPPKNVLTIKKIAHILGMTMDELCFERIEKNIQAKSLSTDLVIKVGQKSFKIVLEPLD